MGATARGFINLVRWRRGQTDWTRCNKLSTSDGAKREVEADTKEDQRKLGGRLGEEVGVKVDRGQIRQR